MENNPNVCDTVELLEEFEDDADILAKMQGIFEKDATERFQKIDRAIKEGDSKTVQEEAHALKGGVANFFADESYKTAFELEKKGSTGDLAGADVLLELLKSQITRLNTVLRELSHNGT